MYAAHVVLGHVVAVDEVPETEDTAWARLEERILAEADLEHTSPDQTAPIVTLRDLEETLVFEDGGDELKCLAQVTAFASCCFTLDLIWVTLGENVITANYGSKVQDIATANFDSEASRIPALYDRNGQWAKGEFAQPGALMAGSCSTYPSNHLVWRVIPLMYFCRTCYVWVHRSTEAMSVSVIQVQHPFHDDESNPGNVFIIEEECDMEIDDVDDIDTNVEMELCNEIKARSQSLTAGIL